MCNYMETMKYIRVCSASAQTSFPIALPYGGVDVAPSGLVEKHCPHSALEHVELRLVEDSFARHTP